MSAENCPVPCISGQATTITGPARPASMRLGELGDRRRAAARRANGLPPAPSTLNRSSWRHITPLGMPGGAAGVEQQQVVAAARDQRSRRERAAPDAATASYGVAHSGPASGVVRDDVPPLDLARAGGGCRRAARANAGVEHDRLGVGVVEQVDELVAAIAVVRVDRDHRRLERGDHRLHVLRAVVEVAGHLRLVPETGGDEVGGERVARRSSSPHVTTRSPWIWHGRSGMRAAIASYTSAKFQAVVMAVMPSLPSILDLCHRIGHRQRMR